MNDFETLYRQHASAFLRIAWSPGPRWKLMVIGGGIGLAGLIFLVALVGAMFLTFRSGGLGG